jgi:uncharacterized phage-associated protein
MTYDGRSVANFVLDRCKNHGIELTHLSLQKIVFFCHAWSLVSLNRPLIREQFEAWQFGPVLPYVYREFREYESQPITTRALMLDKYTGTRIEAKQKFDDETDSLLKNIVDFYSKLSAGQLVQLSHVQGGPWHRVWNHSGKINPGMRIENEAIQDFYSSASSPFTVQ